MEHAKINDICQSIRKNGCNVGERYYRSENDILKRKKMMYYATEKDGQMYDGIMEDPYKANNTLTSGWFKILVDQKLNYSLGEDFTIDIEEIDRELKQATTKVGKEASKKAIGWGYVYIKDGKLKVKPIETGEVKPIYENEEYGKLQEAYRSYTLNDIEMFDIITKEGIETYHKVNGTWQFKGAKAHLITGMKYGDDLKDVKGKGWSEVPLIPLYNNDERLSDLHNIKGLIDIYDIVNSDFANNLEDIQDAFAVVKGFNGGNVSELLNNVKQYKVARVGEGGDFKLETQEIPYLAKKEMLGLTRQNIFISGMGFDTDTVGEGNATNYVIQMRLSNLKLKASAFETQIQEFIFRLLPFINEFYGKSYTQEDAEITFNRQQLVNESELLGVLKDYKGIISDSTLYEQIPFTQPQQEKERIEEEGDVIQLAVEQIKTNQDKE